MTLHLYILSTKDAIISQMPGKRTRSSTSKGAENSTSSEKSAPTRITMDWQNEQGTLPKCMKYLLENDLSPCIRFLVEDEKELIKAHRKCASHCHHKAAEKAPPLSSWAHRLHRCPHSLEDAKRNGTYPNGERGVLSLRAWRWNPQKAPAQEIAKTCRHIGDGWLPNDKIHWQRSLADFMQAAGGQSSFLCWSVGWRIQASRCSGIHESYRWRTNKTSTRWSQLWGNQPTIWSKMLDLRRSSEKYGQEHQRAYRYKIWLKPTTTGAESCLNCLR